MKAAIAKAAAVVLGALTLAACGPDRFAILHGDQKVGSIRVNNISQDTVTIELRAKDGKLERRLVCDKWDGLCIDGK